MSINAYNIEPNTGISVSGTFAGPNKLPSVVGERIKS